MKVQVAANGTQWLTDKLRSIGFSERSQIDVQSTQVYEVHAIALWSETVLYQVVGDSGIITWIPSGAFNVLDNSMPSDWLVNRLDDEVALIIGPYFVIQNKESYSDMVELVPDKVMQFKQRLQQISLEVAL